MKMDQILITVGQRNILKKFLKTLMRKVIVSKLEGIIIVVRVNVNLDFFVKIYLY